MRLARSRSKHSQKGELRVRRVSLTLPPASRQILEEIQAELGLERRTILGYALAGQSRASLPAAVRAIAALHRTRIREIQSDQNIQALLPPGLWE
jgi:hypothetical protein